MEYDLIEDEHLKEQTEIIDEIVSREGLIVLCQNEYARELIEKKYRERPVEYYETYLRCNDKDMNIRKNMLDIEEENAYNQLCGILLYEQDNGIDNDFREEILRKCYNWIYRNIKNSYCCNIANILDIYGKRNKKSFLTNRQGIEVVMASLQIAALVKKPLAISSFSIIMDMCESSTNALESAKGEYKVLVKKNRLFSAFPKECMTTKKFSNIGDIVRYISIDKIKDPVMSDSMVYYKEYLNAIGLDDFSMTNVPYTQEDIDILTQYLNFDNDSYIITEDSKKAIISALFIILSLKKKYMSAKNFALNINMEKEYKESIRVRNEFIKKEKEYRNKIEELQKQLDAEKNKNKKLMKENESKNKEMKRLSDDLKNTEDYKSELISLRKAIYSFENNAVEYKGVGYEEKLDLINKYNIVIFGGKEGWMNNIKCEFSNAKFITEDAKNTNISFVKNADYVFINVIGLSHSFYYKIINELRKHKIKFAYIGNPNKELLVNRMYSEVLENITKVKCL